MTDAFERGWLKLLIIIGLVVLIFYVGPLIFLVNISLQSQSQFLTHSMSLPHPLHFSNFVHAWRRASMGEENQGPEVEDEHHEPDDYQQF